MIYVLISICILRFYLARPVIKTNLKQELISYKSDGQGTNMLINLLHITCRADIFFGMMQFRIIQVLVLVLDKVDNDFIIKGFMFSKKHFFSFREITHVHEMQFIIP